MIYLLPPKCWPFAYEWTMVRSYANTATPEGWRAELTWAPWVNSWLRTVTRRCRRCQLFNRQAPLSRCECVCERLAQGRYLMAGWQRLEPATFRPLIRRSNHYSTRPDLNTTYQNFQRHRAVFHSTERLSCISIFLQNFSGEWGDPWCILQNLL